MAGRKVRTAEEAKALLEEAAANQVHRAEWARRQGVNPRSLNAWRLNLARETRRKPRWVESRREPQLVELVPTTVTAGPALVVRCGLFSVEVGEGFDDDALRRVLWAVASC